MHKFLGNTYTNYSLRVDIIAFSNNSPHLSIHKQQTNNGAVCSHHRQGTKRLRYEKPWVRDA